MSEIEFLNIDLDIESNEDISSIISEFSVHATVMRNEEIDGLYLASFETPYHLENDIIEKYVTMVENLTKQSRKIWDRCIKREFDFGYQSGDKPNNFHSYISAKSTKSLANIGGSIVITIYPIK